MVGALRDRLEHVEETLCGLGLAEYADGRVVFPWPSSLLNDLRQWLNAYLSHFAKASSRHLVQGLWDRYAWLDEYVHWQGNTAVYRCAGPRYTLRFAQQKAWFATHFPGHVLLFQQGGYWDMNLPVFTGSVAGRREEDLSVLMTWPHHFPQSGLAALRPFLWRSRIPVAWIKESGRRLGNIAERVLWQRWSYRK